MTQIFCFSVATTTCEFDSFSHNEQHLNFKLKYVERKTSKNQKRMTKQLKLNELKRVVDVDKFSEYAARLKEKKTSEDEIDRILNELGKKTPSRDVLLKTRLGFLLKDVAENERLSKSVREKAKQLRSKWKEFHKKLFLAPKLDVKCDKPTTEGREKAKKTLETALINTTKNCINIKLRISLNSKTIKLYQIILRRR